MTGGQMRLTSTLSVERRSLLLQPVGSGDTQRDQMNIS